MDLPNQQFADYRSYKLLILGDGGTGKTTFVKRHVNGVNWKMHDLTSGVTVYPLDFHTLSGWVRFNCWDTTGQDQLGGFPDSYYIKADCAIIMFDVTARSSYRNVLRWCRDLRRICQPIPIVLCGNKVDLQNRQVNARMLARCFRKIKRKYYKLSVRYIEISALSNYNFTEPFRYFLRTIFRRDTPKDKFRHVLREMPQLVPPEVMIDLEAQSRNEREFQDAYIRARRQPLPNNEDLM